jgi:hypothetical protein
MIIINNSFGIGTPFWFRIGKGGFPKHTQARSGLQKTESAIKQAGRRRASI